MLAQIFEKTGQPLRLSEIQRPEPGPEEVLLSVECCAVCRTDLHVVDGDLKDPKIPLVPGHEIVGRVVELGSRVGGVKIGDRVGVPWLGWTCGECHYCTSKRENLCSHARFTGYHIDGGYAEYAKAHGLKPRARFVAMANVGDSPTLMLNAPVPAAKKVLLKAGMQLSDIDLFEINEAFAVVAEKFIRDLNLDRDKVNVNGGAMALGHPIGATGSVLIGTVLDELERRDLQFGLVTMCAAGGMAPAIIIERI